MTRSICFVLTSPFALNAFLLDHLRALADDYQMTVCVNTKESPVSALLDPRVELLHFSIHRSINPGRDLIALLWLVRLFVTRRFDAVHTLTPKGGLLGIVAARLSGIPLRTHTFTGQVWATRKGVMRFLLMWMDRIIDRCATNLHADSGSQARFLEENRICTPGKVKVFGGGSISGVNLGRFAADEVRRTRVRQSLGLPDGSTVFLFLGRMQRDKGVVILGDAFAQLLQKESGARLLLVGPDEEHLVPSILAQSNGCCQWVGLTPCPEQYIDAADVLVLPSFREGFGSVILEAAAMEVPSIASRIYGLTDAVIDGETGLLVTPRNVPALAEAMIEMLDSTRRHKLGRNALLRAKSTFSSERLTGYWSAYYRSSLEYNAQKH